MPGHESVASELLSLSTVEMTTVLIDVVFMTLPKVVDKVIQLWAVGSIFDHIVGSLDLWITQRAENVFFWKLFTGSQVFF